LECISSATGKLKLFWRKILSILDRDFIFSTSTSVSTSSLFISFFSFSPHSAANYFKRYPRKRPREHFCFAAFRYPFEGTFESISSKIQFDFVFIFNFALIFAVFVAFFLQFVGLALSSQLLWLFRWKILWLLYLTSVYFYNFCGLPQREFAVEICVGI